MSLLENVGRCVSCKHWSKHVEHSNSYGDYHQCLEFIGSSQVHFYGGVSTKADFGCVLHEPVKQPEPEPAIDVVLSHYSRHGLLVRTHRLVKGTIPVEDEYWPLILPAGGRIEIYYIP